MMVRVIKGRKQETYPNVAHVRKIDYDDGIDILIYTAENKEVKIELPQDAKVVYFMNDHGDTTDSVQWPPKKEQASKYSERELRVNSQGSQG